MIDTLYIAGDPMLDKYLCGDWSKKHESRFNTKAVFEYPGGAFNVLTNVQAILQDQDIYVNMSWEACNYLTLSRLLDDFTQEAIEFYDCANVDDEYYQNRCPLLVPPTTNTKKAVIFSDYNKGMLNGKNLMLPEYLEKDMFEFCVVDSRYRTFDLGLLDLCKVKILHSTGSELETAFSKNFDWVVWTNHAGPVVIYSPNESSPRSPAAHSLSVPKIEVENTCGAGDTFVAGLTSYLSQQEEINTSTLIEGSEFGIRCAQDVCKMMFTGTTTITYGD